VQIKIHYENSWQTGFLSGNNNEPMHEMKKNGTVVKNSKNERKFSATKIDAGQSNPITENTILGVLSRLIGDQRKLYQAQESDNYYFKDIKDKITFLLSNTSNSKELVYLVNKSNNRPPQETFLGTIPNDCEWFYSDISPRLWSVLFLDVDELLDFINSEKSCQLKEFDCKPTVLINQIDTISGFGKIKTKNQIINEKQLEIQKESDKLKNSKTKKNTNKLKEKLVILDKELDSIKTNKKIAIFDENLKKAISYLEDKFKAEYWNMDKTKKVIGEVLPIRLYAASLYLQAEKLLSENKMSFIISNKNQEIAIPGFSKRGFNGVRDWLNPLTGNRKKQVGTPCFIDKQSGVLSINLAISREKAKELRTMIENAGVSSFYLGKKGLAYIDSIEI
jgi:hypothetical protein